MRLAASILFGIVLLACICWIGVRFIPALWQKGADVLPLPVSVAMPFGQSQIDYGALDAEIKILMTRPEMTGLAVAVVERGRLRFVRTYGLADAETRAPVTAKTMFRWASVSKTATGMLAASLAQEKALDLHGNLTRWPNSLRLPQGAEAQLTLAQLLSHQTGLTKNAYDERLQDGQDPAMLRADLANAPLQCAPGSCHTYQNVAFDAASEILGDVAKMPFERAVAARFFAPLGMSSARYGEAGLVGAADWARPHQNGVVRPMRTAYWHVPAAAGVESNIGDFARWMQAMMGLNPDIVAPAVLDLAQSPQTATPRQYSGVLARALTDTHYGLGWRSFRYAGHPLLGHSGAVDGYRATMIFDPAQKTGVVALWNSNWGIPFRLPFAVFDNVYRLPDSRWLDVSDIPLPTIVPQKEPPE